MPAMPSQGSNKALEHQFSTKTHPPTIVHIIHSSLRGFVRQVISPPFFTYCIYDFYSFFTVCRADVVNMLLWDTTT